MTNIRVVLAEDHHVVRAAMAGFLSKETDIEVIGEVSGVAPLLDTVATLLPDVLLLDAHMPGQRSIDVAKVLCQEHPEVKILVLSAYDRREYVVGLLGAGAAGYVLKDDPPETLLRAIRAVAQGEEWVSPRVAKILVQALQSGGGRAIELTDREMEVLRLMANAYRNEDIAEAMVITEQTVKNYVRSIFRKLGVDTRVEAVLLAISEGLVPPPMD